MSLRFVDRLHLTYLAVSAMPLFLGRLSLATAAVHGVVRVVAALVVVGLSRRRRQGAAWRAARDFYSLPLVLLYYEETATLHSALWGGQTFDAALIAAERALFGLQPSLELWRAFPQPWVGELMSVGYLWYYALFVVGAAALWRPHGANTQFARMLTAVVATVVVCDVMFIAFPTVGPQYVWPDVHDRSLLPGYYAKQLLDWILGWGERPTGAFPSSHVAVALVFTMALWRGAPRARVPVVGLFVVLTISTVYIQAHYAVDVLAGALVGLAVDKLSRALLRARPWLQAPVGTATRSVRPPRETRALPPI